MKKITDALDWPRLVAAQPAAGLIPDALRRVALHVDAKPRETLFRIGGKILYVYLVISGEVCLIRLDRNGGELVLQRSRGGFIAEASLYGHAYHCDGIVARQSALLLFPLEKFRATLDASPSFRKAWQFLLAHEIRKLRAQCERLGLHQATDRILHYIGSEGADGVVILEQSRKSWAAELGLTHEALYRTLKRMQQGGTLQIERRGASVVLKLT